MSTKRIEKRSAKSVILQGIDYREEAELPIYKYDDEKIIVTEDEDGNEIELRGDWIVSHTVTYSIRPLTDYEVAEYNNKVMSGVDINSQRVLEKLGVEDPTELGNLSPEKQKELNLALLTEIDVVQLAKSRNQSKYYAVARALSKHPLDERGEEWTEEEARSLPINHPDLLFELIDKITGMTREVVGSTISFPSRTKV